MEKFEYKDYKVSVYMDAMEYAKEFFEVPEGASLYEEDIKSSHGHAAIEGKEIFIYIPKHHLERDLWLVVAHEIGHCIEFNHAPVPIGVDIGDPDEVEKCEAHERRAEFFENFFLDVLNITQYIENIKNDYYENLYRNEKHIV